MAQQESFDPKPYAPLEYRGSFGVVKTKLPGEVFSEMWPETAGVADKLCIVRSMSHGEAAHERGTHNMFTGYRPSPAIQYPEPGQHREPRVGLAGRSAGLCLRAEHAQSVCRHGLPQFILRTVQPGRRSGPRRFPRP